MIPKPFRRKSEKGEALESDQEISVLIAVCGQRRTKQVKTRVQKGGMDSVRPCVVRQ